MLWNNDCFWNDIIKYPYFSTPYHTKTLFTINSRWKKIMSLHFFLTVSIPSHYVEEKNPKNVNFEENLQKRSGYSLVFIWALDTFYWKDPNQTQPCQSMCTVLNPSTTVTLYIRSSLSVGHSKSRQWDPNSSITDVTSPFPPSGNESYIRNRDVSFV